MMIQKLWGAAEAEKGCTKRAVIVIQVYLKKQEKYQINKPSLYP